MHLQRAVICDSGDITPQSSLRCSRVAPAASRDPRADGTDQLHPTDLQRCQMTGRRALPVAGSRSGKYITTRSSRNGSCPVMPS